MPVCEAGTIADQYLKTFQDCKAMFSIKIAMLAKLT